MTTLSLEWIATVTNGAIRGATVQASGVAIDSRTVQEGQLFFAISGAKHDGHDYVEMAFRAGAAAAVVAKEGSYSRPVVVVPDTKAALAEVARAYMKTSSARVVAITGSVGKTSCKEFTAAAVGSGLSVLKSAGNQNTEIGLPICVLSHQAEEVFVLEMAMRGLGQIEFLTSIAQPDIAVITNVGEAHIELLGSRDNIALAKSEILNAGSKSLTAVLNRDDEYFHYHHHVARGQVVSFGQHSDADWVIEQIESDGEGHYSFALRHGNSRYAVRCPWPGRHHTHNVAAAIVVAALLGLDIERAIEAVGSCQATAGRFKILTTSLPLTIIDDTYNASPPSMVASLRTLSEAAKGRRRVAVLGSMFELGHQSERRHLEVGVEARAHCDVLVTVGREARQIASGYNTTTMAQSFDTVQEAISHLQKILVPGDVVLVKGSRGLRMETIVMALQGGV